MNPIRPLALVVLAMSACCPAASSQPMSRRDASALLQSPSPIVIAHRGFSRRAPENTVPAFRMGWEAGADLVELDYYHSKDGIPVVMHDATLDRTTDAVQRWVGAKIPVSSKTLSELKELDAGQWFNSDFAGTRIPSLREVLDSMSAIQFLLIERKGGEPAALVKMLGETGRSSQVIVQAFDWEFIRGCHALAPDLILGALGPPSTWKGRKLTDADKMLSAEWIDAVVATGARVVGWNDRLDARSVALAHRRGLEVWVYTINDPVCALELVSLGVDGIITDDPATVRESIAPRAKGQSPTGLRRSIPKVLPDHPGNIFLEGEHVLLRPPASLPQGDWRWSLEDDEARVLQQGRVTFRAEGTADLLDLGTLGSGWYRLEFRNADDVSTQWTTVGVLARLKAPVPEDSPVCVDSATAWFAKDNPEQQRRLASLAALAGANWVRDRMRWREMEVARGEFAPQTTYDTAADIQSRWGLQVLQVFHDTPPWARSERESGGRFAKDLRAVHDFSRAMARRFHGPVAAWEPWNEANVKTFGAHTVDEMCSWQKAAWLGFKSGDSNVLVGWNPTAAVPTQSQTDGIIANEARAYFDTYNYHTYDWPHAYLDLWEPARAAAGGKPIWITESDRGMKHDQKAPWFDLSREGERLKAELVAQEYAQSLYAGAARHFHFILGHYHEPNGVQFGLLRLDLTPRPAYVALAAAGRFLAGATCLGRWRPAPNVHVFAFRARPDGREQDVLVVWTERDVDWPERGEASAPWPLPSNLAVNAAYDYLGRPLNQPPPAALNSAPVFVLLPVNTGQCLPLDPPPSQPPSRPNQPTSIVLQVEFPESARVRVEDKAWSEGHAWSYLPDAPIQFGLWAYNFGPIAVEGTISPEQVPKGWSVTPVRWPARLAPGERLALTGTVAVNSARGETVADDGWGRLRGDFGAAGQPVVSFRMVRRRE